MWFAVLQIKRTGALDYPKNPSVAAWKHLVHPRSGVRDTWFVTPGLRPISKWVKTHTQPTFTTSSDPSMASLGRFKHDLPDLIA